MQTFVLQLLVVAMMLSIGFDLRVTDLAEGSRRPGPFALALGVNLFLFPLGTWLLADGLGASPGVTTGLVLCAVAPGGPVGLVFARRSGAHLGFSTALMFGLGVVSLVSAPLTVTLLLGAQHNGGLFWSMFRTLLLFQVVPLTIAMALRSRAPKLAARAARPARALSNMLLLAVIAGLLATRGQVLAEITLPMHAGLIAGLLALLLPGLLAPVKTDIWRGAAMVTIVRNLSVALLLAGQFFDDPQIEAAILAWGFWMLLLPSALGSWAGKLTFQPTTS